MSKRILIIEDDPFTKEFYKYIFSKSGYDFQITEDGDYIMSEVESKNVDVIVMDVNLKNTLIKDERVDGITISKRIKSNPNYSSIPIILVTAYQAGGKNNFFVESLADDYIIKPILDFNDLLSKVNKLVESV